MTGGFILLHRGILDHHVFNNEAFCERMAWVWILCQASYEPHKTRYHNRLIEVGRGDVPTSYRRLQEAFQWGVHRVRNFLSILEHDGMITRKIEMGFLIISVCNYEEYQDSLRNSATPTATHATTVPATPTATNITKRTQGTKDKKYAREDFKTPEWISRPDWDEFMIVRDQLKAVQSEQALKSLVSELDKYRMQGHDPNELIKKSMRSSWKDIYPPKEKTNVTARKPTIDILTEGVALARAQREQASSGTC